MTHQILPQSKSAMMTFAAILTGVAVVGAGTYLAWNSRQAKMYRAAKRAGKILYKAGAILQSVAEATD